MSEKTKAVELSDEEMDKVAGGKMTIIKHIDGDDERVSYTVCGLSSVSIDMFKSAYNSGTACSKYQDGGTNPPSRKCASCVFQEGWGFWSLDYLDRIKITDSSNIYDTNGNPL